MKILLIIENGLFATACVLSVLVFLLARKCVHKGRCIMCERQGQQAIFAEWTKDIYRLDIWLTRHPFGPVNGKERTEYKQLITDQIGSYERYCESHNCSVDFNHVNGLRDLIRKDWD